MTRRKALIAVVIISSALSAAVTYTPVVQVVPGSGLPEQVTCMGSNNNLDLVRFDGRLFLGFRTAPTHFAGTKVRMYIVSSTDEGKTWDYETEVFLGSDMREPRFLVLNDKLMFYFFQAGKNPFAFTPRFVYAMERKDMADWTEPVKIWKPGCVLWRAKVRNGKAYITGYCGGDEMYTGGTIEIGIHFMTTDDGYNITPVNPDRTVPVRGGSETAFEFDRDGTLYLAIRNEGGDGKTWGGKVCKAGPDDYSDWQCKVTPMKYDSPIMFK